MRKLLPVFALLALACLPARAYTSYKTVSFGAGQTGQAVSYVVETGTGAVVTAGVSGAVVELGGGGYGAAITVPDGANYFVVWSETSGGATYTASDRIEVQAQSALPTLTGQTTVLAQTSSATRQADMITALTAQGYTVTRAAKLDNADVATSTRSTYAGGPVASVTAPVVASSVTAPVVVSNALPVLDGGGRVLLQPGQAFGNSVASTVAPTWYAAPPTLLAIEGGIFGYTLGGVTFADHILDTSATIWGASAPTHTATTDTNPFQIGGVTYVTSVLTHNAQGQVTSKTVTTSNQ